MGLRLKVAFLISSYVKGYSMARRSNCWAVIYESKKKGPVGFDITLSSVTTK